MISLCTILARMEGTAAWDIPWKCWRRGRCQSIAWSDTQALKKKKKNIHLLVRRYRRLFDKNHLVIRK